MDVHKQEKIALARLNPSLDTSDKCVRGVVSIIWPYSSSARSISILLVEPDFRLRKSKGQVRVTFSGSVAKKVAEAHLMPGENVILSLKGATFLEHDTTAWTPGRTVDWELNYRKRLKLEIVHSADGPIHIDFDSHGESPEIPSPDISLLDTPHTPVTALSSRSVGQNRNNPNIWESPRFLKSTESSAPSVFSNSFFGPDLESSPDNRGIKRFKFGRLSGQWRFADRIPSPERKPQDDEDIEFKETTRMQRESPKIPLKGDLSLPSMLGENGSSLSADTKHAESALVNDISHPSLNKAMTALEGQPIDQPEATVYSQHPDDEFSQSWQDHPDLSPTSQTPPEHLDTSLMPESYEQADHLQPNEVYVRNCVSHATDSIGSNAVSTLSESHTESYKSSTREGFFKSIDKNDQWLRPDGVGMLEDMIQQQPPTAYNIHESQRNDHDTETWSDRVVEDFRPGPIVKSYGSGQDDAPFQSANEVAHSMISLSEVDEGGSPREQGFREQSFSSLHKSEHANADDHSNVEPEPGTHAPEITEEAPCSHPSYGLSNLASGSNWDTERVPGSEAGSEGSVSSPDTMETLSRPSIVPPTQQPVEVIELGSSSEEEEEEEEDLDGEDGLLEEENIEDAEPHDSESGFSGDEDSENESFEDELDERANKETNIQAEGLPSEDDEHASSASSEGEDFVQSVIVGQEPRDAVVDGKPPVEHNSDDQWANRNVAYSQHSAAAREKDAKMRGQTAIEVLSSDDDESDGKYMKEGDQQEQAGHAEHYPSDEEVEDQEDTKFRKPKMAEASTDAMREISEQPRTSPKFRAASLKDSENIEMEEEGLEEIESPEIEEGRGAKKAEEIENVKASEGVQMVVQNISRGEEEEDDDDEEDEEVEQEEEEEEEEDDDDDDDDDDEDDEDDEEVDDGNEEGSQIDEGRGPVEIEEAVSVKEAPGVQEAVENIIHTEEVVDGDEEEEREEVDEEEDGHEGEEDEEDNQDEEGIVYVVKNNKNASKDVGVNDGQEGGEPEDENQPKSKGSKAKLWREDNIDGRLSTFDFGRGEKIAIEQIELNAPTDEKDTMADPYTANLTKEEREEEAHTPGSHPQETQTDLKEHKLPTGDAPSPSSNEHSKQAPDVTAVPDRKISGRGTMYDGPNIDTETQKHLLRLEASNKPTEYDIANDRIPTRDPSLPMSTPYADQTISGYLLTPAPTQYDTAEPSKRKVDDSENIHEPFKSSAEVAEKMDIPKRRSLRSSKQMFKAQALSEESNSKSKTKHVSSTELKAMETKSHELDGASDTLIQDAPINPAGLPGWALSGFRTKFSYFPPLAANSQHFNSIIDIIAVVVAATNVAKATSGPRHMFQKLFLTDPSLLASPSYLSVASLFRRYQSALPSVRSGDIVLLRNFKVQSSRHKTELVSQDDSAWVVFREDETPQIAGPPIEFGREEEVFSAGLRKWWYNIEPGVKQDLETSAFAEKQLIEEAVAKQKAIGTRRSSRKSSAHENIAKVDEEATTHELRNGRKYVDAPKVVKHELRDGKTYAD